MCSAVYVDIYDCYIFLMTDPFIITWLCLVINLDFKYALFDKSVTTSAFFRFPLMKYIFSIPSLWAYVYVLKVEVSFLYTAFGWVLIFFKCIQSLCILFGEFSPLAFRVSVDI